MSSIVDQAICFAVKAHEGQYRKFSHVPYIMHPLEVATIISSVTDDPDVIAAGILHDTVEDTSVTAGEIRDIFGSRVYQLVMGETEDRASQKPMEETWLERKRDSLLALENTHSLDVKILWLADKLSNLRSFCRKYRKEGDGVWQHLHQKDPKMQEWYYRSVLNNISELSDTSAYQEYKKCLDDLFGGQ